MPNHFLVVGLCARDQSRRSVFYTKENGWDWEPDYSSIAEINLCMEVNPLPDELMGIVASSAPHRYVNVKTGSVYKEDCNGKWGDPDWIECPLTNTEIIELKAKYGAATWYDWQQQNWGTKWGAYSAKFRQLGGDGRPLLLEFQCAWGPPKSSVMKAITEYLCDRFYLRSIKWIGHDPHDGSLIDIQVDQ